MLLTCSLSSPDSIRQKFTSLDYRWRSGAGRLLSSVLPNIYDSARVSGWGHVPAVCSIQCSHATLSFLNTGITCLGKGNSNMMARTYWARKHFSVLLCLRCLFTDELLLLCIRDYTPAPAVMGSEPTLSREQRNILTTNDDLLPSSKWARVYFSLSVWCKCHMTMQWFHVS